jgi:hypothetical protein
MMVPHAPASAPAHLGTHFLTTCKISAAFFARFPVGRLFGWLAGRPGRPGCGWSRPNIRGHPRTGPGPPQPPAALAAGDGWQCTHCNLLQAAPVCLCRWPGASPGGALAAGEASTYVHHTSPGASQPQPPSWLYSPPPSTHSHQAQFR